MFNFRNFLDEKVNFLQQGKLFMQSKHILTTKKVLMLLDISSFSKNNRSAWSFSFNNIVD